MPEKIWKPNAASPCPVCGVGLTLTPAQLKRDYSTPEGRETWEAVEKAAAKAPQWMRDEYEALKRKLLEMPDAD